MTTQAKVILTALGILFALALTGCGKAASPDQPPIPTPEPISPTKATTAAETDWKKELTEYLQTASLKKDTNAILYTGSDQYHELAVQKGKQIDIPQKPGYSFIGYTTSDGVTYVDSSGRITMQYIGTDILLLKAEFTADDFMIRFVKDGKPSDIMGLICKYDSDIRPDLPIGRVIGDECIIGLADAAGNIVADYNSKDVYLDDHRAAVDYAKKEVVLTVLTTRLSYHAERLDTYEIKGTDYLKQSLNSSGTAYDCFEMKDCVDLDALRGLGYKTVHIKVDCNIRAEAGKQGILLLNGWPENKKECEDFTLAEFTATDCSNKEGTNKRFEGETTVNIEEINPALYVAYAGKGALVFGSSWESDGVAIELRFQK